jgi:hypothetical protein
MPGVAGSFRQGFAVRQGAWHGLAEVLPDYPGREVAMQKAGHDHLIEDAPVFVGEWVERDSGLAVVPSGTLYVPRYTARRRADTKELVAILPSSRAMIQNDVAWDLVDAIVARPNVRYETAGILDAVVDPDTHALTQGTIYWVLAWLDEPVQIVGDPSPIYPWLLGTWSHDGARKGALRMDGQQPGWFRTVDPDRLDILDQELCVLGQTCGSFSRGIVVLGLFDEAAGDYTNPAELPEDFGFDAAVDTSYVALRTAWTEEIMARRAAS